MKRHSLSLPSIALAATLAAGCGGGVSTSAGVATNTGLTTSAALNSNQVADASASLQGASLLEQVASSASASNSSGFKVAEDREEPSGGTFAGHKRRGRPTAVVRSIAVTTDAAAGTSSVTINVTVGGTGFRTNGTDTVTRVYRGLVSQTADAQAARKEIRDKQFVLVSETHTITMTNSNGTSTATRTCTFGTTTTCTISASGPDVTLSANSSLNLVDGDERGEGTLIHKRSHHSRTVTFTNNADGSITETIVNPNGVTVTLTRAVDGTVSGSVTLNGTTLATITTDASGDLITSNGSADESSNAANNDPD